MSSDIYQRSKNFIHNSKKIHKNRYNYDKVAYVNIKNKVIITCPIHGDFKQTPIKHLYRKQGCPSCGGTKKSSNPEFIEKAKKVHGDKYEYMLVNYKGSLEKVQIVCHKHGVFKQTPKVHLEGCGCPKCGGHGTVTHEDFIMRCRKKHKSKYDYSLAKYITGRTKVTIICSIHGNFEQTAELHMMGHGCPSCNNTGGYCEKLFNKNKDLQTYPGRLYLLKFTDTFKNIQFLKIGITQTSIETRFRGYSAYDYEILIDKELELYRAFLIEQHILRVFNSSKFKPNAPFDGRTECFTTDYTQQIIKTILDS